VIIRARLEDFETKEEIKAAKKLIRVKTKEGLKDASQRAVLPEAKRLAPAIAAATLTTKATTQGAFLTTLGPRKGDDITGLLNFGGYQKGVMRPRTKRKRALSFNWHGTPIVVSSIGQSGRERAHWKGAHFLEAAINDSVGAMEAITAQKVQEAFGRLGA
jgi:hypothetical protein